MYDVAPKIYKIIIEVYKIIIEIYKIASLVIDICILIFVLKIIYDLLFGDLIEKYKNIKKKEIDVDIEKLDNIEAIVYTIIKLKKIDFFIIFLFYIIMFKSIAPILFFLISFKYIIIILRLTKKDTIIENKKISSYVMVEISNYCEFKKIIKYLFLTILDYSDAITFSNIYNILKKKKNKKIKQIIEKILISKIIGISYKYVIYSLKITLFFILEFPIRTENKKYKIKIITFIKMLIKSPIIVINNTKIIPIQVSLYNKRIIKEKWKIRTNPLLNKNNFSFLLKYAANGKMYPNYIMIKDKIENQKKTKIHQAVLIYDENMARLYKFTSSEMVENKKTTLLYEYDKKGETKKQYYRVIKNNEILKEDTQTWKMGILKNFYILHKLHDKEEWLAFYIRIRIEMEIENKENREELEKIKKIQNSKELIKKVDETTYLGKILKDGLKALEEKEKKDNEDI